MSSMLEFLRDFESGKREGRYVAAELPSLPFANGQFDLALCSHFLFLYSAHLSLDFHLAAVAELCRIAKEVRIFPLLDLAGVPSKYVKSVIGAMQKEGRQVSIEKVPYEFQRGGCEMLKISSTR